MGLCAPATPKVKSGRKGGSAFPPIMQLPRDAVLPLLALFPARHHINWCSSVGLKTLTSIEPKGGRSSETINLHPSPGICRAGAAPAKKLRSGTPSCAGPFREKNPLLPTLVILLQIFPDVT